MENINVSIEQIKTWFCRQLEFLKSYPSENHRLIILISLIDSFAQEHSGFSRQNQREFVKFIQTYSVQYASILNLLCPITLYYSLYDENGKENMLLQHGTIYCADSPIAIAEAQRLLDQLPDGKKEASELRHSYAGLIYQLRNKLTHEFMSLNMPLNFQYDENVQLPHMACENKLVNKKLVFERWTLHIPEDFVKKVAIDAVEHYLEECLARNYVPFSQKNRKCYNGWYD